MYEPTLEPITCAKCKETKPADSFSTAPSKRNGRQSWCRQCTKINAAYHPPTTAPTVCTICKESKPADAFELAPKKLNGIRSECRDCRGAKRRARHLEVRADPVESARFSAAKRRSVILNKYGLTDESFGALLESQGGRCAICTTDQPGGKHGIWHIDHKAGTSRARGILCHHCNVGLGHFGENEKRLLAAIEYLRRHGD